MDQTTESLILTYNGTTTLPNVSLSGVFSNYEKISSLLQSYLVPIIIVTGFVGNTICFIVFVASPLKRISTSVYLAALAFSDTGFLVCLSIGWLESLGIRLFHKEGICQLTVYAAFVFSFTSVWFVNAFTTEMYIAVFHPRKCPNLSTPKNAKKIVCLLSVVACLIYTYAFWIAKIVQTPVSEVCRTVPEDVKTATIVSVIDMILTLLVPFTMIMFMITRLFLHISKFYKPDRESQPTSSGSEANYELSENHSGTNSSSDQRTARQASDVHTKLTRMLVVTVVVFLVLNLPSHVIKVQYLFRSLLLDHVEFTEMEGIFQTVFQILYYANFSVNFLLYSVCGKSFRSALIRTSPIVCIDKCKMFMNCPHTIQRLTMKSRMSRGDNENGHSLNEQQHSRLVDIHLNEIRFSQLPSIESQFVYKSPPCLLAFESENLLSEPRF